MNSTSCKIYTDTAASKLGNLRKAQTACCPLLLESVGIVVQPTPHYIVTGWSFKLPVPAESVRGEQQSSDATECSSVSTAKVVARTY
jgi:hypothetical protein